MGRYTEHPLPPALATVIGAAWSYRPGPADADRPPAGVRVLPDGHTDVIVSLAAGRSVSASVSGPTDHPKLFPTAPAAVLVGVRLRHGWAGPVLGVAPADLFGGECEVRACGRGPAGLLDRLGGCSTAEECVTVLTEGVAGLAAGRRSRGLERAGWAADRMTGGEAVVAAVARRLGVSERTLHRDVVAATGLPPSLLARVRRFQAAVGMLGAGRPHLATVAAACGYADQSHLTREVRRFAGLPPAALVAAGRAGELQV